MHIAALVDVDRVELEEDLKTIFISSTFNLENFFFHLDKVDSVAHQERHIDTAGLAVVDRRLDSLADKFDFVVDSLGSVDRLVAGTLVAVVDSVAAAVDHLDLDQKLEHFLVVHDLLVAEMDSMELAKLAALAMIEH